MPANLVLDEDIQDELADLTAAIAGNTGLVEQWSIEFIAGIRDIEDQGQWDTCVSELERAGVNAACGSGRTPSATPATSTSR